MKDNSRLTSALQAAPIVPVMTLHDPASVAPLSEALIAGGIRVAEITLRTPAALEVIAEFKRVSAELVIGAGTVLSEADIENTIDAGAEFIVTPGLTDALAEALQGCSVPAVPGVATPGEAMQRHEQGFELLKLFPATALNGLALLKSLAGPLPHLKFFPTGGITPTTAPDFLALPNVKAIGGSWLVTGADIEAGHWEAVKAKAISSLANRA